VTGTGLWVSPDELRAVGQRIAAAPHRYVVPPDPQVTAAAGDPISAQVAYRFAVRAAVIGTHSRNIAALTEAAGALVQSNAASYTSQELANAAALTGEGGTPTTADIAQPPLARLAALPDLPVPSVGPAPGSGKDIARVVHTGPGPSVVLDAAQRLQGHGNALEETAAELRGHTVALIDAWQSDAAHNAERAMLSLAARHDAGASAASNTVDDMRIHAESVARLRRETPTPAEFDAVEMRLRAAAAANRQSNGMYAPVVAQLQTQTAELHRRAVTAYANYTAQSAPHLPDGTPVGPDDSIVGDRHPDNRSIQLVDNRAPLPQDPPPRPPTEPRNAFLDQYRDTLTAASDPQPPPVPMPGAPRPPFTPEAPGPMVRWLPEPSFGERVGDQVRQDVGRDMVKGGFQSALQKAALGAAFGAGLTPEFGGSGALPGAVLGFVGGFAQGVVLAPGKAAARGAWGWLTDPIPGTPAP
jgi:hypothetical protein